MANTVRGDISSAEKALALATERSFEAAGGVDVILRETPIGRSQVYRYQSVNDRDSITVRDAVTSDKLGARINGHPFILRAMARQLGFALVRLPEGVPDAAGLHLRLTAMTRELGDVAEELMAAQASDSEGGVAITSKEAERIREEAMQLADDNAALIASLDLIITGDAKRRGGR